MFSLNASYCKFLIKKISDQRKWNPEYSTENLMKTVICSKIYNCSFTDFLIFNFKKCCNSENIVAECKLRAKCKINNSQMNFAQSNFSNA